MSQMLKCPNPSCPFLFDPSQTPVGVVLSCPRCGMQFTLGPPSASPPSYPATPAPSVPAHAGPAFNTTEPAKARQREPLPEEDLPPEKSNKTMLFILGGVAIVLMGVTVAVVLILMTKSNNNNGTDPGTGPGATASSGTGQKYLERNLSIGTPPAGWIYEDSKNSSMWAKLGKPFFASYKRKNSEAYIAIGSMEPGAGRQPRNTELNYDLSRAFEKLFDPTSRRPEPPAGADWLNEPLSSVPPFANGYTFRAISSEGSWAGEAYTVAHKGIGYFWLAWCSEGDYDKVKEEFADFRSKVQLLDPDRRGWKELLASVVDFKGTAAKYTISDAEGKWKPSNKDDLESWQKITPSIDKVMQMKITPPNDRKAQPETADLFVYVLPGADDPKLEARRFAEERETKEAKGGGAEYSVAFEELTGPPQGEVISGPDSLHKSTPVIRLRSTIKPAASSGNKLIVVSGIKSGDKTVVVVCSCAWSKRDTFETRFMQIASSLR